MADLILTPETPLGGLRHETGGVAIVEITDRAIVSVAVPLGGRERLNGALTSAYGVGLPDIGTSMRSDATVLLGLQTDLVFLVFDRPERRPDLAVREKIGDAGHVTDQSDAWVALQVCGPKARATLERICPLDLHSGIFTEGTVARTVMEHLGVIIHRDGADSFLMLSARSSAESFARAVVTSAQNVT